MNYTLAIFKSRFATLNFANLLRSQNVPVAVINTPQSLSRACGISVKFLTDFYPLAQQLLIVNGLQGNFVGFFAITNNNGRQILKQL